jgi:hypothetical protein
MQSSFNEDYDFNIWQNSIDPKFLEISARSKIPEKWLIYGGHGYEDSPIKPINRYVENLYPGPELISINNNTVVLRQRNHAEIFLLDNSDGFRNIDRPHMRQYYQSSMSLPLDPECFDPVYAFYTPWILDHNVLVDIVQPSEDGPFLVHHTKASFFEFPDVVNFIEPQFVPFRFKKSGEHMVSPGFGKIKIGSPMFDMVFEADDILVEKIRKFYEQD